MKKCVALLLALLLLVLCAPALGEDVIINKIDDPNSDFAFPEDAQLLEVYFPAVYGVDAAYVRYGDYSMLIDCGGITQWEVFDQMLASLGVTEVTYAHNSHPDGDHIGGFNHVLEHIACGEFLLGFAENSQDGDSVRHTVYKDLHALNIPFRRIQNGDTIEFGDVKVDVYQRLKNTDSCNNRSVMLMFELGQRRIFFTGDIQKVTQKILIDEQKKLDLHADIVKYPHHGYANMQAGFLKMVSPQLVIITSNLDGAGGRDILNRNNINYLFTYPGTLRLATDGQVWLVERID